MAQLLDKEKFKSTLNEYFQKKLEIAVAENDPTYNFPLLTVLMLVHFYKLFSIVIIIFASSYFLSIFWLIYCKDMGDPRKIGPDKHLYQVYDIFSDYYTFYTWEDYDFIDNTHENI